MLAGITDCVPRSLNKARYVFLASFDVAGAFGCVPHHRLMAAMEDFGVCLNIGRVVRDWPRGERFRSAFACMGVCSRGVSTLLPEVYLRCFGSCFSMGWHSPSLSTH